MDAPAALVRGCPVGIRPAFERARSSHAAPLLDGLHPFEPARAGASLMRPLSRQLSALVHRLRSFGPSLDRARVAALLAASEIELDDVTPFVQPREQSYARRRVARTEHFEALVMTWRPGQGSAPHDHGGSICGIRILQGAVHETRYAPACDGLVDPLPAAEVREGEVLVDSSEQIHALENRSGELLVTLHVYAPPLPELRRFVARPADAAPLPAFVRDSPANAPTVAIVGGGFSGTMVAANLVRLATDAQRELHVVLVDRQAALGEGPAYRTADPQHVLNVPAANMSAWPDRPSHFAEWARARDPRIAASQLLPRKVYGEYVREAFYETMRVAGEGVRVEVRRTEALAITPIDRGWSVSTAAGAIRAAAVVLATGHRQPDDPLRDRWSGRRTRYIEDPWSSLALSAIEPDEPVVLLGTGLTAMDVLLTLTRSARTAPVLAISRRGRLPFAHARVPESPIDAAAWLEPILARPEGVTARALVAGARRAIERAESEGRDWRAVIDGLRRHTPHVWRALPPREAERFVRHVRSHWEIRRHRMGPEVADRIALLRERGILRALAARVHAARANDRGITLELRARGERELRREHVAWVVNCTGPGTDVPPILAPAIESGHAARAPLGLGILTDQCGRVIGTRGPRSDLACIGTLRKPRDWESTAVPELRAQALEVARVIADHLAVG